MPEQRFTFPVAGLQAAHTRAREMCRFDWLRIPDNLTLDPTPVLAAFDCLWVKPGWVLCAYVRWGGHGADARVVALPQDHKAPEDELRVPFAMLTELGDDEPYVSGCWDEEVEVPPEARRRFMSVVEGDGTPYSYLCASLAVRHLLDFAAFWHDLYEHDFFEHRIVAEWPSELAESYIRFSTPQDLSAPEVEIDGGAVTTRFYTYRPPTFVDEEVWRHEDRYEAGSYEPLMRRALVALGRRATRCY